MNMRLDRDFWQTYPYHGRRQRWQRWRLLVSPPRRSVMGIHSMAVVDPEAEIHPDAIVGPFCHVGPGVKLAAGVELRGHVTVYGPCTIGKGTICFPGAVIGGDPQDRKFRGEPSEVHIGEDCRIHECATINKGTAGGGMVTKLGDRVLIMAYAHLAHDCIVGSDVVIGNNSQLAGHVHIGDRAIISGMVGVHHFVSVGELSFVGGMSGVRFDVPPYCTVEGYPAEPRQVNVVGLRRAEWSDEDISATRAAFRALYRDRNGRPLIEALEEVKASDEWAHEPVQRLCEWIGTHLEQGVKGRVQESLRVN